MDRRQERRRPKSAAPPKKEGEDEDGFVSESVKTDHVDGSDKKTRPSTGKPPKDPKSHLEKRNQRLAEYEKV